MYYCSLQLRSGVFSGYLLFHKCVGMYYLVLESPHISTVRKHLPHCSHLIKEKMSDNSIFRGFFWDIILKQTDKSQNTNFLVSFIIVVGIFKKPIIHMII